MKETYHYDDSTDTLTINTEYDRDPVVDSNKKIKNSYNPKAIEKYKGNMVHAARFSMGDITRLKNLGYNLLSPDKEEVRRALVYVQTNEPHLMLVHGKPFTKQRIKWA